MRTISATARTLATSSRCTSSTFAALATVELAIRALLGDKLGHIDPCAHLNSSKLGPTARQGD
ncbi:hypothetical protein [Austwickia chelonae]|uniref:hypothetical protein n=1 Tax=Austwickia chelonae TaxID=100225 RepID=UPI001F0729BA|nr:hypothetical protein [Austwickia chelonae]